MKNSTLNLVLCIFSSVTIFLPSSTGATDEKDKADARQCKAMHARGIVLHDSGKYAEAQEVYNKAFEICGDGYSLLNEIGLSLAAQKKYDKAADYFIREILHPPAPAVAFGNLFAILDKLSPEKRKKLKTTGSSADEPIYVPSIGTEYSWTSKIVCDGQQPEKQMQALISHEGHRLDRQSYTCADGTTGEVYFDFSADPVEQAFDRELKKMNEKGKK